MSMTLPPHNNFSKVNNHSTNPLQVQQQRQGVDISSQTLHKIEGFLEKECASMTISEIIKIKSDYYPLLERLSDHPATLTLEIGALNNPDSTLWLRNNGETVYSSSHEGGGSNEISSEDMLDRVYNQLQFFMANVTKVATRYGAFPKSPE